MVSSFWIDAKARESARESAHTKEEEADGDIWDM